MITSRRAFALVAHSVNLDAVITSRTVAQALGIHHHAACSRLSQWGSRGWLTRVGKGLYRIAPGIDAPKPSPTIRQLILAELRANGPRSPLELFCATNAPNLRTFRCVLSRLHVGGKVRRVSCGVYAINEVFDEL